MAIADDFRQLISKQSKYVLLERFRMPTEGGSKAAIAVTAKLWYLFVLVAIALAYRNKSLTRNHAVANVTIWNSQASPLSIVKAMFEYRSRIPSIVALVSPYLIIGAAAPVNQNSIYIPTTPAIMTSAGGVRWYTLQTPQYLRAIDSLQSKDLTNRGRTDTSRSEADVVKMKTKHWTETGEPMYEANYSYTITGVDFGLQRLPDLVLEVEGSCNTEYNWYRGFNETLQKDNYALFGNDSNPAFARTQEGQRPFAKVVLGSCGGDAKCSFALITTSLWSPSFTEGSDPWYRTEAVEKDSSLFPYRVMTGRPALSCWEESHMSYRGGQKKRISKLAELDLIPAGLREVFENTISIPVITLLIQNLGTSSLKSALSSIGKLIDAESARIDDDLTRLLLGAYVFTRNVLAETTMFDRRHEDELPNHVFNKAAKQYKEGVSDFVIYGSDVAALDLTLLTLIPVLALALFVCVNWLTDNPIKPLPWAYVNALKASVLYSSLDEGTFDDLSNGRWKRKSQTPHYTEKKELALMRPKYERGIYSWGSSQYGTRMQFPCYEPEPFQPSETAYNNPYESPRAHDPNSPYGEPTGPCSPAERPEASYSFETHTPYLPTPPQRPIQNSRSSQSFDSSSPYKPALLSYEHVDWTDSLRPSAPPLPEERTQPYVPNRSYEPIPETTSPEHYPLNAVDFPDSSERMT